MCARVGGLAGVKSGTLHGCPSGQAEVPYLHHAQPSVSPTARGEAGSLSMDIMSYTKPYLTVPDQVALLRARGCDIGDQASAEELLTRVGYYRLSGYWYPFRQSSQVNGETVVQDDFISGTTLSAISELYEFDRRLRLLVLDAIERVEVAMRFQVGHTLGSRGAFAHTDPGSLSKEFAGQFGPPPSMEVWRKSDHATWLFYREKETNRSKADFVKHFKAKYGLPLPVWVVTELLDFGGLTILYSGMLQRDRDAIAKSYGIIDSAGAGLGGALQDWMKNLNFIRNVCAHHSRFWNVNVTSRMSPNKLSPIPDLAHLVDPGFPKMLSRPYASLAVLAYLTRRIDPTNTWFSRLRDFMDSDFPDSREESEMGFPDDWRDLALWDPAATPTP